MKSLMLRKWIATCVLIICAGQAMTLSAQSTQLQEEPTESKLDSVQEETVKKMVQLVAALLRKEESAVLLKKKGARANSSPRRRNGVSERSRKLALHKPNYQKTKAYWDSLQNLKSEQYITASDSTNKIVMGFHPYWMGSAYESYNFNLLSDLAFFSISLDPNNGLISGPRRWREEALQDSVITHNGRFHLTVNCFSNGVNGGFMELQTLRSNTINELTKRMDEDTLIHGLVLDFEFYQPSSRDFLSLFVEELHDSMKARGKVLSMTLPAVDLKGTYDITRLSKSIDYFLLMGYDYFGSWSKDAGPGAPLASQTIWGSYSVEASIDNYLHRGVDPASMLLVVPYYGTSFQVAEPNLPTENKKYQGHLTYRQLRDRFGDKAVFESVSQSVFVNEQRSEVFDQVWFDNARSLSAKYDLAIEKGLAGVGIWALGYDNGYKDLWELLDKKFGSAPPEESKVGEAPDQLDAESLVQLITDPSILGPIIKLLATVILAAFLLSLRNKPVRDLVFQSIVLRWVLLLMGPLVCVYVIFTTPYATLGLIALIGVVGGYCVYFLLDTVPYEFKRRMP